MDIEDEEQKGEEQSPVQKHKKTTENLRKKKNPKQSDYFKCFYEADYLIFKGFCFFIYAAYGGFIPYLPLYFKQLFLGASYAGIIIGIRPLIQCVGAPFWGVIADRYHAGKVIFLGSVIAWIVKAFLLLAVRPHNQQCIEIYLNETSNMSYVYAYDLWNTEATEEPKWVVIPLHHPIMVEKNRITVVDTQANTQAIKDETDELPEEVLIKNAPLQQRKPSHKNASRHHTKPRGKLGAMTAIEKRNTSNHDLVEDADKDKNVPSILGENEVGKRFELKFSHMVKVYNEELDASVEFITQIDTYEIDFMFVMFTLIIIIGEFFESPTYALSDASLLKRLGDDREYYGRIRMWGSLGWAMAATMVGLIINYSTFKLCQWQQNNYIVAFFVFIGFVAAAFVNALWFRFTYDEEKKFEDIGKVAPILLSLRHTSFLMATLYTGFCYGILVHFVNWVIDDLGGSSSIMGAAGAAREIAAIIMFAMSATTLQALGDVNTMVFSLLAYIICFICYSNLENPWMAVALELLDGGTYGLVWSCCVHYMSDVGTKLGVVDTTQGILQGIFWGLGNGGGTMISGALIESFGATNTFRAFALGGTVVLVILILAQYTAGLLERRENKRKEYELLSESESDGSKSEEPQEHSEEGEGGYKGKLSKTTH
ncbi:unnamed protein product [Pocillopora meandrina]|uniref:Major facilitator superfamily associated domain-containing protein n=1 Tax=Pocillopora meandrina TaxID=46732 RepID=A0AAU9WZP0_9CNID|nr:unnamed protein product [Pocillopora meandrina]